ncbi:GntR family transcriptional regulator [Streptomyces viridochromogenes]|uniref:GntR family transcriptional regulator n=1 Tax=Streptomyces viridochromogenes TaxID=1938 RepID=A0A0J7ZFC7_STRVR|nr:PLP-dependent aminotransferase family protein [Streptomyces viridochromogenes]KMS74539.1 GntR family transcriptional regulator [Streptomyces viridochromogenes]KOG21167.1 GntR family transcriptional regulator [Streptomyces viridochromogenes]KOG22854.1 GntR family transcriptional regulator [Streptomyces viridochromogenes]
MDDYRRLADRLADDIAAGRLKPGERLPPQRAFARRRGIAGSTAGRVYAELVRRGLVVGEVGRGTFVRAAPAGTGRALVEAATAAPVNLELNYPSAPGQSELLAPALAPLLRPDVLTEALSPAAATGTPEARQAAAALLATPGWRPVPDRVLFTGNARQAVAATLASLVRPGGRVGVEALTYPVVKEIAARLGITLVPLATDEEGPRPESVAAVHRTAPLAALYLQPTLHNPTSVTTSPERRRQLAFTASDLNIPVVEDRIWSFLTDDDPLAVHAPGLTHVVDGLSKRVAPGLTVGFVVVPEERVEAVAAAVRSGGWSAGRFAVAAAVRWVEDGTVERLVTAKRADAARRQRIAEEELRGFTVRSDPRAYHVWWELPAPWRADTFTAAAAARGVAVTPGPAFAVDPSRTPDAVRLGLGSVPGPDLRWALRRLAGVVRGGAPGGR